MKGKFPDSLCLNWSYHSSQNWRLRQILNERKQQEGEKLSSYITDIRKQCSRLQLPPFECLHHFVQGLRPDIKEYVALQQPTTLENAENLAKLKEILSLENTSKPIDTTKLTQDIVQQLKDSGVLTTNQPLKLLPFINLCPWKILIFQTC